MWWGKIFKAGVWLLQSFSKRTYSILCFFCFIFHSSNIPLLHQQSSKCSRQFLDDSFICFFMHGSCSQTSWLFSLLFITQAVFQADMLGHVAQKMSLLMLFLLGPQLPEPTLGNGRRMPTELLQQCFCTRLEISGACASESFKCLWKKATHGGKVCFN